MNGSGAAAAARSSKVVKGEMEGEGSGETSGKTEKRRGGGAAGTVAVVSEGSSKFHSIASPRVSCLRYSTEPHRRNVCTDNKGRVIEPDRLTLLRKSVWRVGEIPAKDEETYMDEWADDWGNSKRLGSSAQPMPTKELSRGISAEWCERKSGHTSQHKRILMMMEGDERCRRSRGISEKSACLVENNDAGGWGHMERAAGPTESTAPTYSDKCPTTLGTGAPHVRNVAVADVVEDTIELYVLDTTLRRKILANDADGAIREVLSDFDEARTLRKGEELSHGHFRKWRRAWETHYRDNLGKPAFWVHEMGSEPRMKEQWNAAFRHSQSFALGDLDGATPARVKFDCQAEYYQRQIGHMKKKGELDRERWKLEAMDKNGVSPNQADRIASLRSRAAQHRSVSFAPTVQLTVHQCRKHVRTGEFISQGPALTATLACVGAERVERYTPPPRLAPHTGAAGPHSGSEGNDIARVNTLRACAAKGSEERPTSLDGLEHLLCTVNVKDCEFVSGNVAKATEQFPLTRGGVLVEDTRRFPGLIMHVHADGAGATSYVDRRVNGWITRQRSSSVNLVNMSSRQADRLGSPADGAPQPVKAAARARAGPTVKRPADADANEAQPAHARPGETTVEEDDTKRLPEFMSSEVRASISKPVIAEENLQQIKRMLQASETACDDLHKFNPTEFDMQNAMRINLTVGAEAPPPEFRKQGHHMLEIIAAQIKEMEDAGWVYRGKSVTACPIHMVRKGGTGPGEKPKWRITCDYRELNKVIQNHSYPLPEVNETIRAVREQACESHRQDLERGITNPDRPAGIDPKGHDPGVSFISVGDLAKAFYHMPVHPDDQYLTAFTVPGLGTWMYRGAPMGVKTTPSCWKGRRV